MYKLTKSDDIQRLSDGVFIPADEDNGDYSKYLEWLAEGNTPAPAPASEWRTPMLDDFKARREVYLNRLTGIAGRAARASNTTLADAADAFAEGLLVLTDHPSIASAQNAAELKTAIMTRYAQLSAAAAQTSGAKATFDKVSK